MVSKCFAVLLFVALLQFHEAGRSKKKDSRGASAHQGGPGAADEDGLAAGTSGNSNAYDPAEAVGSLLRLDTGTGAGAMGAGTSASSSQQEGNDGSIITLMMPKENIEQYAYDLGDSFDTYNLRGHLPSEEITFSDHLFHVVVDQVILLGKPSRTVTNEGGSVLLTVKGNYALCAGIHVQLLNRLGPDVMGPNENADVRDFRSAICIKAKRGSIFVFKALFSTSQTHNERPKLFISDQQVETVVLESSSAFEKTVIGKYVGVTLRERLLAKLSTAIEKAINTGWNEIASRSRNKVRKTKQEDVVQVKAFLSLLISEEPAEELEELIPALQTLRDPPNTGRRWKGRRN